MEDETVFRFLAKARLEAKGDEAATVRLALRHAESAVARLRHLLGTLAPNDWEPAPKSPRGPETTLTHSSSSAGPQDCVGQFMGARLGDMADDVLLFVCGFLALQAKARLRGASSRLNVALMGCPIDLTESTMVADKVDLALVRHNLGSLRFVRPVARPRAGSWDYLETWTTAGFPDKGAGDHQGGGRGGGGRGAEGGVDWGREEPCTCAAARALDLVGSGSSLVFTRSPGKGGPYGRAAEETAGTRDGCSGSVVAAAAPFSAPGFFSPCPGTTSVGAALRTVGFERSWSLASLPLLAQTSARDLPRLLCSGLDTGLHVARIQLGTKAENVLEALAGCSGSLPKVAEVVYRHSYLTEGEDGRGEPLDHDEYPTLGPLASLAAFGATLRVANLVHGHAGAKANRPPPQELTANYSPRKPRFRARALYLSISLSGLPGSHSLQWMSQTHIAGFSFGAGHAQVTGFLRDLGSSCLGLVTLRLDSTKVAGRLEDVASLVHLETLSLRSTECSGSLKAIRGMTGLAWLDLGCCPGVTGELDDLKVLRGLALLHLETTKVAGHRALLGPALPKLKSLNLKNTPTRGSLPPAPPDAQVWA
eukprot:CAMPEP_0172650578 /NCGR_PEP_ID=MMETSP1068-20121228/242364_1 /TAXON_ID=35684 /ORGANISM="Pseudopedinella elastica, Strain CCMP716" /LENGTH=592 /DNA_ID=CAMNT_0013464947 /DNA_START=19 /DNA_END=1798 /DNA_ORIENTATION=+